METCVNNERIVVVTLVADDERNVIMRLRLKFQRLMRMPSSALPSLMGWVRVGAYLSQGRKLERI